MYRFGTDTLLAEGSLAFGYNFASGDDDATDNKHKTFDNLYPSGWQTTMMPGTTLVLSRFDQPRLVLTDMWAVKST